MTPTYEILSTLDRLINDRLDANTKAIAQNDSKQIVATANQLLALLDARKAIQECIDDTTTSNRPDPATAYQAHMAATKQTAG